MEDPKEVVVLNIPVWTLPSYLAIAYEYTKINEKGCPNCGSRDIEKILQQTLPKSKDWPYSIGGDKINYQCKQCNKSFEYIFNFRKPRENESIIDIIDEMINIWLDICSLSKPPDYSSFSGRMYSVKMGIDQIDDPDLYGEFLGLIANKLVKLENRIKQNTSEQVYFKKFTLLLFLCSSIPKEDYEVYIEDKVSDKIKHLVEKIRRT